MSATMVSSADSGSPACCLCQTWKNILRLSARSVGCGDMALILSCTVHDSENQPPGQRQQNSAADKNRSRSFQHFSPGGRLSTAQLTTLITAQTINQRIGNSRIMLSLNNVWQYTEPS